MPPIKSEVNEDTRNDELKGVTDLVNYITTEVETSE